MEHLILQGHWYFLLLQPRCGFPECRFISVLNPIEPSDIEVKVARVLLKHFGSRSIAPIEASDDLPIMVAAA